ncbi:cryptochrome DASH, chloroplastic/mitochondrial-like isoform X2 [Carya illinoinensis]|uniref:cryptochrome DASH, chloroplastic/mitochondrial-like isoform X2 n=1 Tax=Carya illinoinensis TaxID=32201 RepID=UPI001C723EEB|nr:cryptochrome DASH, chloroplastic/mitochondrial-like isoform X2 [Carya illinoinensis]
MATVCSSVSSLSLTKLFPSRPSLLLKNSNQLANLFQTMNSISKPESRSSASATIQQVPGLDSDDMDRIADQAFQMYSSSSSRIGLGGGTAIVWFRNDLRVLDNEALYEAWVSSQMVLPVYCVDPRLFGTTYYFGFPKTGALRAQFLIECLADLKKNLIKRGLNLLVQHGKPEEILPSLAKAYGAHTVYAQKETCSEELNIERLVSKGLQRVMPEPSSESSNAHNPKLQLIWGTTMYHIDDLPYDAGSLPDVYTQFRKSVEAKCTIRGCIKTPASLGPPPSVSEWGYVPSIDQLGFQSQNVNRGMKFVGGESAALGRVNEYFWKKDLLKIYKETRNGMLGPDYSTKLSPWLASGSLSPRFIHAEVKRYEKERQANNSTYWFLSVKYGNSLFHIGGPRKVERRWSQDKNLFESWRNGRTGYIVISTNVSVAILFYRYPLIDANMKELSTTGFMSNRGRQIVCSFLVRDMGIDWRMGAEWFETCLLDFDPCSNYGNWTYGAGVGNDPREDRYFSIPKQAQTYDPEGEYVAYWLPQLRSLPKEKRNFPGKSYNEQVVPLKFKGAGGKHHSQDTATAARRTNYGGMRPKGHVG